MLNIVQLQMNLKFLNYYHGKIDGIKGTDTIKGCKAFQKNNGLDDDGIYGTKTDAKLVQVIKQIQEKIGTKVDGVAGNNTISACKEYQKRNGLAVDGICGTNTRQVLNLDVLDWNSIKYFKKEEFTCKCGCGQNNMHLEVVKIADEIREHFGNACIVNSASRCIKHNKNVGGVANSRHLSGKAVDLYVKGVNGDTLLAYTKNLVAQGKLRYTYLIGGDAVHIDIN